MKKGYREYAAVVLLILAAALSAAFGFIHISYTDDKTANGLISDILPRAVAGAIFVIIIILLGYGRIFTLKKRRILNDLLWCLPCLAVAIANFPISALISGSATVERTDLVWLFIIKCIAVAVMEETLFRGLIQQFVYGEFQGRRYGALITAAISAAVFGLFHLVNALTGADFAGTLLQAGYSFLIGAMLAAVMIKTENLYICVALHCLFDIGGLIIPDLGTGNFQDALFWALTAVAGIVCFIHILYFLLKRK